MSLIETEALTKRFRLGEATVEALSAVTFSVEAGEAVAITGASGSGKSTLMHLLGCLDLATSGTYRLYGQDVSRLARAGLARFRNSQIGFVFQNYNLLPRATAFENVELPLIYAGEPRRRRRDRVWELLASVGLEDRAHHLPAQLSGGQQQRAAIARALANRPKIVLADEPTGALDSRTGQTILGLLNAINREGVTVLLITHEPLAAAAMRRVLTLCDGRLISDSAAALRPASAPSRLTVVGGPP